MTEEILNLSEYYIKKTNIVDDLVTNDSMKPLSAKQGKILSETLSNLDTNIDLNNIYYVTNEEQSLYTGDNYLSNGSIVLTGSNNNCNVQRMNAIFLKEIKDIIDIKGTFSITEDTPSMQNFCFSFIYQAGLLLSKEEIDGEINNFSKDYILCAGFLNNGFFSLFDQQLDIEFTQSHNYTLKLTRTTNGLSAHIFDSDTNELIAEAINTEINLDEYKYISLFLHKNGRLYYTNVNASILKQLSLQDVIDELIQKSIGTNNITDNDDKLATSNAVYDYVNSVIGEYYHDMSS